MKRPPAHTDPDHPPLLRGLAWARQALPGGWAVKLLAGLALTIGLAVLVGGLMSPFADLLFALWPPLAWLGPGLALAGLGLGGGGLGYRLKLTRRTEPGFPAQQLEAGWRSIGRTTGLAGLVLWGLALALGLYGGSPGLAHARQLLGGWGLWGVSALVGALTFWGGWQFLTRPQGMLSPHPERQGRLRTASGLLIAILGMLVLL